MAQNPDLTYNAGAFTEDYGVLAKIRDGFSTAFLLQRQNLILWLPVSLGLGIGAYFSLLEEPSYVFTVCAFVASLVSWLLVWNLKNGLGLLPVLYYAGTALFLVVLGFSAAQFRTYHVYSNIVTEELSPVRVEGRIISVEALDEGKGKRLVLDRLDIEGLAKDKTPVRIRLSSRQEAEHGEKYSPGQRVSVLAGLNPPSPPVMPSAFDFQQYAYFKQLGAFGFTFEAPQVIAEKKRRLGLTIERLRGTVVKRISDKIPVAEASFLSALMAGKRSGISEEHWTAMRDSGLAHMLAISGLHVGMVSAIVFFAVRGGLALFPFVALRRPIKKYAALAALLAAFVYMLLVGSTVPTVRALLMTGIVLFAIIIDRNPFSLRLVALSAFVILLFLPEALLGASFQMSFAAVTALIFFYELTQHKWSEWYRNAGWFRRVLLYFVGVSLTTVIAGLATGLFSLYHFQQFANYSLLANFLAVPLMAFIVMPLCVLSYALMPFGLEGFSLGVAAYGVSHIIDIAEEVAGLPTSTFTPAAMSAGVFIPLAVTGLFVVVLRGKLKVLCFVPLVVALIAIKPLPREIVLFSSTAKSFAVVIPEKDTMYVSSRRYDRFAQDIWARRYGIDEGEIKNIRAYADTRCDEFACRITLPSGEGVSYIFHSGAGAKECHDMDIVLSSEPIRHACTSSYNFDIFDMRRQGTVLITIDGAGNKSFQTVRSARGNRPWAITNHR